MAHGDLWRMRKGNIRLAVCTFLHYSYPSASILIDLESVRSCQGETPANSADAASDITPFIVYIEGYCSFKAGREHIS